MDLAAILSILDATIRLSTPLLLACLAGMYSERAGIFDIGLEGKMLAAAFAAGAVAAVTGSAWLGLLAGMAVSLGTTLLQGAAAISLKGNQLIAGVAINMLAAGLTTLARPGSARAGARRRWRRAVDSSRSHCHSPMSCRACRSSARSITS
jgi:ABC-type uncharacterized transport system permease subunit